MNQSEQAKRIEKLERQVMLLRSETGHNAAAIIKLRERIEKLEAALAKWLMKEAVIPLFGFDYLGKATAIHFNPDAG
jgi:hypothetical protein